MGYKGTDGRLVTSKFIVVFVKDESKNKTHTIYFLNENLINATVKANINLMWPGFHAGSF